MTKIKSFSVGNGDMFYVRHSSSNFTVIDCCLPNDDEMRQNSILNEIKTEMNGKKITRFISTHPDQDHLRGLTVFEEEIGITNFYSVDNMVQKEDPSRDFIKYCQLRDNPQKCYNLEQGMQRKWFNESDETNGASGLSVNWPIISDSDYKEELQQANKTGNPNNISPIIEYSLKDGANVLWMGDLETGFMEKVLSKTVLNKVNILFAPHHGRKSGEIPKVYLEQMNPDIVVIGEAPSRNINYYEGYNTITQNSSGDISFYLEQGLVHVYTSEYFYELSYLVDCNKSNIERREYYKGTLVL